MVVMAPRKKQPEQAGTPAPTNFDRYRKPIKKASIPMALAESVESVARERFTDFTTEVIRYVREGLEREGRLPKPESKPKA